MTPTQLNEWRIIPRLMALVATIMGAEIAHWYTSLESASAEQTAFASTVIMGLIAFYKFYMETGSTNNDTD